MGIETAIIVATVVAAGSKVVGGIEANKAAREKAKLINKETLEAFDQKENEVTDFLGTQQAAFAKSGVNLAQSASATDILQETRAEGERQKLAIIRQGKAEASQAKSQGRQALISGIGGAAQSVAGGIAQFG